MPVHEPAAPVGFCGRTGLRYPTPARPKQVAMNDQALAHIARFQHNKIEDLEALRQAHATCGIVAIDTEPWGIQRELVSEVAFSFLPPLGTDKVALSPPKHFDSFFVPTYTISVVGRAPVDNGRREGLHYGIRRSTCPEDIEDAMVETLEMISSTVDSAREPGLAGKAGAEGSTRPPLILAGWDLKVELKCLREQYPRVLKYFSAWIDMQEHFRKVCTLSDSCSTWKSYRYSSKCVGMADALRMLGYGRDEEDCKAVNTLQHRAGNDTVRVLAVILNLLNRAPDAPGLLFDPPKAALGKQKKTTIAQAERRALYEAREERMEEKRARREAIRQGNKDIDEEDLCISFGDDTEEWVEISKCGPELAAENKTKTSIEDDAAEEVLGLESGESDLTDEAYHSDDDCRDNVSYLIRRIRELEVDGI